MLRNQILSAGLDPLIVSRNLDPTLDQWGDILSKLIGVEELGSLIAIDDCHPIVEHRISYLLSTPSPTCRMSDKPSSRVVASCVFRTRSPRLAI